LHDFLITGGGKECRIDDNRLLNLINQRLKARIKEPDGCYHKPEAGTPQGGVISPILANIYLHYALDLWFEKKIKPTLKGRAMLIRYADDFVVAFQYRAEAQDFYLKLAPRLNKFNLELAQEKTSNKRFSRFHAGWGHFGNGVFYHDGFALCCATRYNSSHDKNLQTQRAQEIL
jgi:RNA-directed DNA polymerase